MYDSAGRISSETYTTSPTAEIVNYTYDANGNMTAMPTNSRSLTWNTENQPVSITSSGTTETYTYDADGARIKKQRGTVTTYYIGGLYEEDVDAGSGPGGQGGGDDKGKGIGGGTEGSEGSGTRTMYTFNGQVVAQRTIAGSNTLIYLHSDHLGSVGASTTSAGASLSSQEYDPWGKVRTGGVTQTTRNFPGQKLDDTGLLFYNSRYYDPGLGRFTSADSIVPGPQQSASLTVDFHEAGLASSGTNNSSGPLNPQTLNRYTYVLNNPVRHTDPSGHRIPGPCDGGCTPTSSTSKSTAVAAQAKAAPSPNPVVPTATPGPPPTRTASKPQQVPSVPHPPTTGSLWDGIVKRWNEAWAAAELATQGIQPGSGTIRPLYDGAKMRINDALDTAADFLGPDPIDMGNGRFVSKDGLRQVRMDDPDILGQHDKGPHINFERLRLNPKTGRMEIYNMMHIYFTDK